MSRQRSGSLSSKMTNIFDFRDQLIQNYEAFSRSFTKILSKDIAAAVRQACHDDKRYWPEPLVQINPCYKTGKTVQELSQSGKLEPLCGEIFRRDGKSLTLYKHQEQAIDFAEKGQSYVVTTGTGSGKSLTFFIPIINRILQEKKSGEKPRTRAIILYPMNALANSQLEEINKYLSQTKSDLTVGRYTGQEKERERENLRRNPPDILLTNYMMLELVLMRYSDREIVENCRGLEFLVLDELHTYRGRQGADVAMLIRRLRVLFRTPKLICIGTSATMASGSSREKQNQVVAGFASRIFGEEIPPIRVIGETLQRVTMSKSGGPDLSSVVKAAAEGRISLPNYETFRHNPFSVWVERNLSVTDDLARAEPLSIEELTGRLAADTHLARETAEKALKNFLSFFGSENSPKTPDDRNPFPLKLHQFLSGPGKVYVTLEAPEKRTVTLDGQAYVQQDDEGRIPLFEAHFCRECGEEYIPVWAVMDVSGGGMKTKRNAWNTPSVLSVLPRSIDETNAEDGLELGYLTPVKSDQQYQGAVEELPDDWREEKNGQQRVKSTHKKHVPIRVTLNTQGAAGTSGTDFWFLPGKFRICLHCLTVYSSYGRDRNRLIGLSGEGRSSATSILTLQILRQLYEIGCPDPKHDFRKLLGFVDNRQDAALQAGHFNDFINQLLLRSGLVAAMHQAGGPVSLTEAVNHLMRLFGFDDPDNQAAQYEYLRDGGTVKGKQFNVAQELLRFTMSYRLLRDLEDQNLYTCPSLEKLGLLSIGYDGLEEIAKDDRCYRDGTDLKLLPPNVRKALITTFLNEIRRIQCIDSRYFDAIEQHAAKDKDYGLLSYRWSLFAESDRDLSQGMSFTFDSALAEKRGSMVRCLSSKSQIIRRLSKLPEVKALSPDLLKQLSGNPTDANSMIGIVSELTAVLCEQGLIRRRTVKKVFASYRLNDGAIRWSLPANTGEQNAAPGKANEFFLGLYRNVAQMLEHNARDIFDFEAEEHTAQVSSEERQVFEMRFRGSEEDLKRWKSFTDKSGAKGAFRRLPVLYCSPTMELGIDISDLNQVYMRNVPPTPANYVQRAGRAGRSGQQALVLTYCASMSPHDQWFFSHPGEMVQGIVKEPTLDLSNEALVRTHLHSLWMTAVGVDLPTNVADVLNAKDALNNYPLSESIRDAVRSPAVADRAVTLGREFVELIRAEIENEPWWTPNYVEAMMHSAAEAFDKAFGSWRMLYSSTINQIQRAHDVLSSYSNPAEEKIAKRRFNDALCQKALLTGNTSTSQNNDFYTYRYLANQGFLPGYNFPSMPMTAWMPSPQGIRDDYAMISRARFLGISEFGPRNLIYHRNRIYRINRLKLESSRSEGAVGAMLPTRRAAVCPHCGYAHLIQRSGMTYNECENCGAELSEETMINNLYPVSMVETEEVERITMEDENRRREGFDMRTLYRFASTVPGRINRIQSSVHAESGEVIATMAYGSAASVWRVNLGWRMRRHSKTQGFPINPITGYWARETAQDDSDPGRESPEDAMQAKAMLQTIVPYVTDVRNILLLEPKLVEDVGDSNVMMATLEAAIKRAIEQYFQVEPSEIFVEPLPDRTDRRILLIYESGEGGSGILRHLATNPDAIRKVADLALQIMHYRKPDPTEPWRMEELSQYDRKTSCEAGCYECLLTYFNQPDHTLIDRRSEDALRFLMALANSSHVDLEAPAAETPQSDFEDNAENAGAASAAATPWERFKALLMKTGSTLPDKEPKTFKRLGSNFDGAYTEARVVLSTRPLTEDELDFLEEVAWEVIDISQEDAWEGIIAAHPEIFRIADN